MSTDPWYFPAGKAQRRRIADTVAMLAWERRHSPYRAGAADWHGAYRSADECPRCRKPMRHDGRTWQPLLDVVPEMRIPEGGLP